MKKIKILRVTPSYASFDNPGSGLNSYYHCKSSEHKNFVLTEDRGKEYFDDLKNVVIHPIKTLNSKLAHPNSNIFFMLFSILAKFFSTIIFLLKSKKIIDQIEPDIVHIYSPIYSIVGLYCKLVHRSIFAQSLHGTDALRISKNKFLNFLLRFPDINLSLTKSFVKKFPRIKNLIYLGNGFDGNIFFNNNEKRKKNIINVGNLRWQKSHIDLINSFKIFLEDFQEYSLHIVGDGELREDIIKQIQDLKLTDKIILHGVKDAKAVAKLYNQSDFFVLTSVSEGSPKVIMEAMSCGLPVVGTDVGDVGEIIGTSGELAAPGNANNIYLAMKKVAQSNHLIDRNNISRSIQTKEWKCIVSRLEKIYIEKINEKYKS